MAVTAGLGLRGGPQKETQIDRAAIRTSRFVILVPADTCGTPAHLNMLRGSVSSACSPIMPSLLRGGK